MTVSVELRRFPEDEVAAEKLQVVPAGKPLHMKVTAELAEKPFCGEITTLVVLLPPGATLTAVGVTISVKSGMAVPAAGIKALTWLDAAEVPTVSVASTT